MHPYSGMQVIFAVEFCQSLVMSFEIHESSSYKQCGLNCVQHMIYQANLNSDAEKKKNIVSN